MGVTKKKIKTLISPFDVFERHQTVAKNIKPERTILDVGGGVDALSLFIKNKIVVANLSSGDVLLKGKNLPFDDKSFDIVTSIDVLEHISKTDRQNFINELLRVARKKIIIAIPLGTKQHLESEQKILSFLEKKGIKSVYLKEHVQEGLPQEEELKKYIDNCKIKMIYSGDFRLNNFLSKIDASSFKNPYFDKLFYFFKRLVNIILNIFYFPFCCSEKSKFFTNRLYLFIEK